MKLGIILGIIAGIIVTAIAAVLVVMLVILPATREVSSTGTPVATNTPPITTFTNSPPPITNKPPQTQSPTIQKEINFGLNIPSVTISGINSVDISAQLSNTGRDDAHNVVAILQALYQGNPVKVNDQDSITISLGTIASGQTVSRDLHLTFGLFDALKISQNGATFRLTINSDEKTDTLSYDYVP